MRELASARRAALPVLGAIVPRPASHAAAGTAAAGPAIGVVTLGCDKNTVDSERILARLHGGGARIVDDAGEADVIVINTCGFVDIAKEESIEAILDAVRLKRDGQVRAVIAMGCLVQRYKTELERELPEVDLFLGLTEVERLEPELRARGFLPDPRVVPVMERPLRRLSTRTPHTSYLKISEGCDHGCAFCAIPLMRGKHRSTPIDRLVREAAELDVAGVVELNIVSQDTTWYGRDLVRGRDSGGGDFFIGKAFDAMPGPRMASPAPAHAKTTHPTRANPYGLLTDLLCALLDGTAIPWFRLFYMYPSGITRELVEQIARESRIVPYLDMPIQHGSDAVLERMRRPERRSTIRERVGWLRDAIPDLTLRTTVIVGFPGETESDFDALLDLLDELRFDRLGAFSYSVEENTRAATMTDQVPESVRRERLERVLDLQRAITAERNEAWVGREAMLLVDEAVAGEVDVDSPLHGWHPRGGNGSNAPPAAPRRHDHHGPDRDSVVGRTASQAREVDGIVRVSGARGARPGDFIRVRITGSFEEDLLAERVSESNSEAALEPVPGLLRAHARGVVASHLDADTDGQRSS